jgi:hypothetical protein
MHEQLALSLFMYMYERFFHLLFDQSDCIIKLLTSPSAPLLFPPSYQKKTRISLAYFIYAATDQA